MKKDFLILWISGVLGTIAGLPYAFALQESLLVGVGLPIWQLMLIATVQTAVVLAVLVYLGLLLTRKIGLSLNLSAPVGQVAQTAVFWGVFVAVGIAVLDIFFAPLTPGLRGPDVAPVLWKTLLASLYGGIVEELVMRLFFMSLFVWLLSKLARIDFPHNRSSIYWLAIILAAVLFGIGHLPATAALTAVTPIVVLRAIVLNGLGGLVFGWLYWKRGFVYAAATHFITDIVLLAIIPFVITAVTF